MHLHLTDYQSETRWRWALFDDQGNLLADHEVALDPTSIEYKCFLNVPQGLRDYAPFVDREDYATGLARRQKFLHDLGEWAGEKIFGGLRAKLIENLRTPATVIQVTLPAAAQTLLFRPFELAHVDGEPLATSGLRLIYMLEGQTASAAKPARRSMLRVLAIFSLPDDASPLNLREERYQLKQQLGTLAQTKGLALLIRTIQYGATRATLQDALADGEGWDIIHFSGHGLAGELVLEKEDGTKDLIPADDFVELLSAAAIRPQLVTLSACYSGAASLSALRAERAKMRGDADNAPTEERESLPAPPDIDPQAPTRFPSLAQQVAQGADCAVLAMRYAVGDEFAIALLLGVFDLLLRHKRPLPDALQLALAEALKDTPNAPETSAITPLLFGPRAATLQFNPPPQMLVFDLAPTGLGLAFPPEPRRFVGRLMPMLRASRALAPESGQAGVLFYGMAGAGKTACALELAYRHERDRFMGYVWFKAPDEDVARAPDYDHKKVFTDFLLEMERQLSLHELGLTTHADQPAEFARRTAPRLKDLLTRNAILVVIDNAESLLTDSNHWRDPKWKTLIDDVLLAQTGASRLLLTSRRLPAALVSHPRLYRESIHALSWRESALLARALPNLRKLSEDAATRDVFFRALDAAQGHPKLLELADGLAAKPDDLRAQIDADAAHWDEQKVRLFFTRDESAQAEADYVAVLSQWTRTLAANLTHTATLLLYFLARIEEEDMNSQIVEANWEDFLKRLASQDAPDLTGFREADLSGLAEAMDELATSGLVEARSLPTDQSPITIYQLHPAIAETARALAPAALLAAADWELGDYWIAVCQHGIKTEMQGGGHLVVLGGKHGAPYLLRAARWEDAGRLLERVIHRDTTPATLAFALPALRQIAEATKGTDRELIDAGVLANALLKAGRYAEAEQMERDLIDRCVAQGNYRLASVRIGDLLNLLMVLGRAEEALPLAEQKAGYTRRAGLGPWTQLGDEGGRLQLLNALGRYEEVLAAVERLRPQLSTLPETSAAPETANPWNVREALLDTGHSAAMGLGQWETMLTLNAEVFRYQQARNADAMELARTRFNDYSPLLRLRRYPEARALLEYCRATFEQAHELGNLGKVFSALADLEDKEGHRDAAVRFEQIALRYRYQVGEPEDCAISHNNLANYLKRLGQSSALMLAHRLADALICFQIGSGGLQTSLRNLQSFTLPPQPPSFQSVVQTVEQIEGVRFAALFAQLPQKAKDGDEAIAAVWEMVLRAKGQREAEDVKREEVLAQMSEAVRKAFELDGEEFSRALKAALEAMPPEQSQTVLRQLREAKLIGGGQSGPDMEKILREWDSLLRDIAAVANGDDGPRAQLEEMLPKLEANGWQLMGAVMQLWRGERDEAMLTAGIDPNSARLVARILELVRGG